MSIGIQIDKATTSLPLFLTVNRAGVGGITGLAPTVSVRDAATLDRYLDFGDNTFKTSGWSTKYAALSEVERGHYQRALDVSTLPINALDVLVAEYRVDNGADVKGDAADVLVVVEASGVLKLLRQSITNRMDEYAGNPGLLILYDDDGVTPLKTWQLRDGVGGTVQLAVGAPARRSRAYP